MANRQRLTLLTIAMALILVSQASAGHITLNPSLTFPSNLQEGKTYPVTIKITNSGNEAANSAGLTLDSEALVREKNLYAGKISPSESFEKTINVTLKEDLKPGSYILSIMLSYQDANDYQFSSMNLANEPLTVQKQTTSDLELDIHQLQLPVGSAGRLKVTVENNRETASQINLSILSPQEISVSSKKRTIALDPKEQREIFFDIQDRDSLAGSAYGIHAIAEYENQNHYVESTSSLVKIVKQKEIFKFEGTGFLLAAFLLLVLFLASQLIDINESLSERLDALKKRFHLPLIVDILVLVLITAFLLSFFKPSLLFSNTITTGGDTASHYYTAEYLKNHLLPDGKLFGWCPGNYAGFPILQYYFFLPFLIMVLMEKAVSLQVAFKLISVSGTFLLPICAYLGIRFLGFKRPVPVFGAISTLAFLFMEANSMWGANIPSTLAGEFSYSLSTALMVLFFGTMYFSIKTDKRKYWILNAILLALIAFTHVYTVIFAVSASIFLLAICRKEERKNRLLYMVKTYGLAFAITCFWTLPLIFKLKFTTPYDIRWVIDDLWRITPAILLPFILSSLALPIYGFLREMKDEYLENPLKSIGHPLLFILPLLLLLTDYLSSQLPLQPMYFYTLQAITLQLSLAVATHYSLKVNKRIGFLYFSLLIAVLLYYLTPYLGIVDIRIIPFIQLFLVLTGAIALGLYARKLNFKGLWIVPIVFLLLTTVWVNNARLFTEDLQEVYEGKSGLLQKLDSHTIPKFLENKYTGFIPHWIEWNYRGFEGKDKDWNEFQQINEFLKGNFNDSRVVYEHSDSHNRFGSTRAFESLPLFSNRGTLEGLYMQSSISAPFVFYIQSEVSDQRSCPFWRDFSCTETNLTAAFDRLDTFNVGQIIAVSEKTKKQLSASEKYLLQKKVGKIQIFGLERENDYVVVPEHHPVFFETDEWQNSSYQWFKEDGLLDTPLVFSGNRERFKAGASSLEEVEKIPVNASDCITRESIEDEEIRFATNCTGKPHIIRMSYYPNWQVEGADEIYRVSPSFMLVYPEQENVHLYYGSTLIDQLGLSISIVAILVTFFLLVYIFTLRKKDRRFFNL